MISQIFLFLFVMWLLLLVGGGILVVVLGPISFSGFGSIDSILSSAIKAISAVILLVIWIFTLSKIKNWIFQKQIHT